MGMAGGRRGRLAGRGYATTGMAVPEHGEAGDATRERGGRQASRGGQLPRNYLYRVNTSKVGAEFVGESSADFAGGRRSSAEHSNATCFGYTRESAEHSNAACFGYTRGMYHTDREPAGFFPGYCNMFVTCLLPRLLQDGSETSPATSFP
ncbi:hypothetical protein ZWY2020_016273 [Hordeum vulgare]|nr:hypothetical protein ZWY2020_016273 [Hordeum vulgare]